MEPNQQPLSLEEQQKLFSELNQQMLELKDKDPEKYLASLKELNAIIEGLNQDLESLK